LGDSSSDESDVGCEEKHSVPKAIENEHQLPWELDDYLQEPALPMTMKDGSPSDPLGWWKLHEKRYPVISKMARRCLAQMATSVPCESLFSTAGRAFVPHRRNLEDVPADATIYLARNLDMIKMRFGTLQRFIIAFTSSLNK